MFKKGDKVRYYTTQFLTGERQYYIGVVHKDAKRGNNVLIRRSTGQLDGPVEPSHIEDPGKGGKTRSALVGSRVRKALMLIRSEAKGKKLENRAIAKKCSLMLQALRQKDFDTAREHAESIISQLD